MRTLGSVIVAARVAAAAATGSLAAAAPPAAPSPGKTSQLLFPATGGAGRGARAADAAASAFVAWIPPDGVGGWVAHTVRRDFAGPWGRPARVIDRPAAP